VNIFFFGGTFDPPHKGHLSIIQYCIKKSHQLILIPTRKSPLKDMPPVASPHHRIKMLELLIDDINHNIIIDSWDINNPSPNYTYDTIKHLQIEYPASNLFMVLGGDHLSRFKEWKNNRQIIKMVKIIAFSRIDSLYKPLKGMHINWIEDFQMDISSTHIRDEFAAGRIPIKALTSEIVVYIRENQLYGYQS